MKATAKMNMITDTDTPKSLEIEIEELEPITAPEPVLKIATNHNETFLRDERM